MRRVLLLLILANQCSTGVYAYNTTSLEKADLSFQKGDYQEAIRHFERAIPGRTSADARVGLARVLCETGEYDRAERVIRDGLKAAGTNADLKTCLAEILNLTGRYEASRKLYKEVLSADEGHLDARLGLGRMQWAWGEKVAARKTLQYFVSLYSNTRSLTPAQTSIIAEACVYLDRFRDANNLFYDATEQAPYLWQAFVRWGELMLAKYNTPDASGIFEDALKINPNSIAANLGLSKCRKFTQAETILAEKALQINPKFVPAHDYLAELAIARGQFTEALEHTDKALDVNANSLSTRSLRAVAFYFQDDMRSYEEEEHRILAINDRYANLYYRLAELQAKRYLFKESVEFYRKAIALDPEHWNAFAGLGTSLSRLGYEEEAKKQLERAFAKDPYNKYVGNLLTLFDELPAYETDKTRYLTLRLHKDDAPVLGRYARELADESMSSLLQYYKMPMDEEIILEIFPTHDDFAVRCFGMPGAQAFLGICFGNVVAMDSPRARTSGDFVWGETLWHELVHVSHLRMTANRIPRWLAEGIAVFETSVAKPHWRMALDWPFIMAFKNDRLLPLKELDSGFNNPDSPGQITLSYFQASLIVEFVVQRYGRKKLKAMFPHFKSGLKTPEVVESVFDMDIDAFDQDFRDFISMKYRIDKVDYEYDAKRFADAGNDLGARLATAVRKKPNSPLLHFRYGTYSKERGDYARAVLHFKKTKDLFPDMVDKKHNPYEELADIYIKQGRQQDAIGELRELALRSAKDPGMLLKLAKLARESHDYETAVDALQKAIYISPFSAEIHKQLGMALLELGSMMLRSRSCR